MDNNNVISYTNNLDQLESDYSQWQMLTYDQKKISDMECLNKYGLYNTQLYEKLKAEILGNAPLPDGYLNEAVLLNIDDINNLYQTVQTALVIMRNDPNIVLITPYDSLDKLQVKISKYNASLDKYRMISDNYSIELFKSPVMDMYERVRKTLSEDNNHNLYTIEDVSLMRYENEVKDSCYSNNSLQYHKLALECMIGTFKRSNYEKVQMQNILDQNPIQNEINYDKFLPEVVPFMTIDEYSKYNETKDLGIFDYITIEDGIKYIDTIRKLQYEGSIDTQLKLGWNPNINITPESLKYARDKQISYLNELYNFRMINLTNYTTSDIIDESVHFDNIYDPVEAKMKLYPIFICMVYNKSLHGELIKKVTNSQYSHVGIALDSSLDNIYSFTYHNNITRDNGFGSDTIRYWLNKDKNSKLAVAVIFVDSETYKKLKRNIKWFENNKYKTKYNFKNAIDILLNKVTDLKDGFAFMCSNFVDMILRMCNIELIDKNNNLVVPGDFYKLTKNPKIFLLYEGLTRNYKSRDMDKKIRALYHRNTVFKKEEPNIIDNVVDAIKSIGEHNIDTITNTIYKTESTMLNTIAKEMNELIKPEEAIVSIDPNKVKYSIYTGELSPNDYQEEFDRIVKSLHQYDSSKSIDILKDNLSSIWYLKYQIEKELSKIKDPKNSIYQQLSTILNSSNSIYDTYYKLLKNKEKDFDMSEYINISKPFNHIVDITPFKYSGYYIK